MTTAIKSQERATVRRETPSKEWHGIYRGIGFSIKNWSYDTTSPSLPEQCWNHYIYLILDNIPAQYKPESFWLRAKPMKWPTLKGMKKPPKSLTERKLYRYYDHPIIGEIEFHGSITWYAKKYTTDDQRYIEIGCDYQHSWDQGHDYDLQYILRQVEKSIDSLYKLMPKYKGLKR